MHTVTNTKFNGGAATSSERAVLVATRYSIDKFNFVMFYTKKSDEHIILYFARKGTALFF